MTIVRVVTFATAVASLITGGSLYAFSTFVMPALDRLSGTDAITAMQAINVRAPRSLLMLPLVASIVGTVVVGAYALLRPETPHRVLLLVAAAVGVIAFVITPAYHIPHNEALAKVDPHAAGATAQWVDYSVAWTRWNHARTIAYLASGVALIGAIVRSS
jgi:uncharacterized membrane protein